MFYPSEFIAKCKEVYPDWPELHKRLASGSVWAGRYLDDASQGGLSADEILATKNTFALYEKARHLKAKRDLYEEWGKLYDEQFPKT